jgi:hypothetical protein
MVSVRFSTRACVIARARSSNRTESVLGFVIGIGLRLGLVKGQELGFGLG